ncbi:hypothetical protein FB45DRAFT_1011415 [Roridomyces roridus]|uniref:Uncharacterized protein n=1 Tax=Roridomyces roridus TaxID=1738132 RepID=A0AAD7F7I1_9AGAR|nr:hypothetical protein FB45DRAFT_1011415 [Roridomyces roridus]
MPVSFTVATHPANEVTLPKEGPFTAEQLLAKTCPKHYESAESLLQSSFTGTGLAQKLTRRFSTKRTGAPTLDKGLVPNPNGLVNTIISAYNNHHNLILRPDDIWLCVLTQFNFFVNANAEVLRATFVAHEGKRDLTVYVQKKRHEMDFGALSREMVDLLHENLVDPSLRAWIIPTFSTTTTKDRTVAAITMMSTLQGYFRYFFEAITCGIPRITLEGTKADWQDILRRLEKLKEYGIETIAWYHLLVPVITRFVRAFDAPEDQENVEFWQKVAHFIGGSGVSHYSGWISAFCVFDPRGKWLGRALKKTVSPDTLAAAEFWSAYADNSYGYDDQSSLTLDGTTFHMTDSENIPSAYVHVPVKLVDRSEPDQMWSSVMVAGVVGTQASASALMGGKLNTVQPVTGWWIFREKE